MGRAVIVYSVKIEIDSEIESEWLHWMRSAHVPDVVATGCFSSPEMRRVLDPLAEHGVSYVIEYRVVNLASYEAYQRDHAPRLQAEHSARFAGRFRASRSIQEVL